MNYLGEFPKKVERTPTEWALQLIEKYGQIDAAAAVAYLRETGYLPSECQSNDRE